MAFDHRGAKRTHRRRRLPRALLRDGMLFGTQDSDAKWYFLEMDLLLFGNMAFPLQILKSPIIRVFSEMQVNRRWFFQKYFEFFKFWLPNDLFLRNTSR
jgi:hypothetical protein